MLTAILVDDMPAALDMLQRDIEENHTDINIIGRAQSVVEAAKLIRRQEPDILFLDIMLGDGSGFDVLEILPDLKSQLIFVTASDQFAIRAFKFAAIDYVLKPYSKEDLAQAIDRARAQLEPNPERVELLRKTLSAPDQRPQKISLHTLDKITIVNLDDIVRCESDSNNTSFFFQNGDKIFVTRTLKHFADMLQAYSFLRVHQRHLINLRYVDAFIKSDGGYLMMKNGDSVPVSVRKKPEILGILSQIHKKL